MREKVLQLLLVEDDRVAVMGFERALKTLHVANPLRVARDGLEALAVLRGEAETTRVPRPCLLLLDLNLPRLSGLALLEELRRDAELHDLPVFVLTTSSDENDRSAARALGVLDYLVKTNFVAELRSITTRLGCHQDQDRCWLTLPEQSGQPS